MKKAQRLSPQEEQEVFSALGLKSLNESIAQPVVDDVDAELAKLTQHKKNLFLHEAARGVALPPVLKALAAGAQVNAEERAYPHYGSFEMAINSAKSAEIILCLWQAGGVCKHQIKTKTIHQADGTKEQLKAHDMSQEAFEQTWALIMDRCDAQLVSNLIDQVQTLKTPEDAEKAQIVQKIKASSPQKHQLLNLYAKRSKWTDALYGVKNFGGELSAKEWDETLSIPNLRWIFGRDQHSERRESVCAVLEHIHEQMPSSIAENFYALAIQNDALDLMSTLLKLKIRPNEDWQVDSSAKIHYYGQKNSVKSMENIFLVAQRYEATRCLPILAQIPTVINKLTSSKANPETIAALKVSEMQKMEQLGVDLSVTDEKGNNFLHCYALKTTEAVAGWPTLARWHSDLLNTKNNDGVTPVDVMRERIKRTDRNLVSWGTTAEKVLEAFEKTVSRAEATVLRKEVADLKVKKASKKTISNKMRRL